MTTRNVIVGSLCARDRRRLVYEMGFLLYLKNFHAQDISQENTDGTETATAVRDAMSPAVNLTWVLVAQVVHYYCSLQCGRALNNRNVVVNGIQVIHPWSITSDAIAHSQIYVEQKTIESVER